MSEEEKINREGRGDHGTTESNRDTFMKIKHVQENSGDAIGEQMMASSKDNRRESSSEKQKNDSEEPKDQETSKEEENNEGNVDNVTTENSGDTPIETEHIQAESDDAMKGKILHIDNQMMTSSKDKKTKSSSDECGKEIYLEALQSTEQALVKQESNSQEHNENLNNEEVDEQNNDQGTENVLDKLELSEYFPDKITLQTLRMKSKSKANSLADIPWYFLYKILMLDYEGRDDIISKTLEDALKDACDTQTPDDSSDKIIEIFENFDDSEYSSKFRAPHPMDVVIAVFRCSSNHVRQMLCEKMFMCKLGIPIVLPPYMESKSLLLLWALRSIAFQSRLQNGELQNSSVVNIPMPVISCIRLGEVSRSKSKFLNEMVNSQSHDSFFHRDCMNGMNDRTCTDGMIEIAWRINSQKSKKCENFEGTTAFLNLRGDGTLQETNVTFLTKISNVLLVMIDINQIENPSIICSLNRIKKSNTDLVCMVTSPSSVKFNATKASSLRKFTNDMRGQFKKDNIIYDFNAKGCMNIKDLRRKIENKITDCLGTQQFTQTLESMKYQATSLDIVVDEHTPECSMSKVIAVEVLKELNKGGMHDHKIKMLPLQGKPWHDWATLNKEQHRREKKCSENLTTYMDNIYIEKNQKRLEQLTLLKKTSPLFDSFLNYMLSLPRDGRIYFLKWIKLYLDDKSKQVLPALRKDCCSKWNAIRQCDNKEKFLELQKELDLAEQKLSESSFGLEHLMREMAQMYEAVAYMQEEASENVRSKVSQLPKIMAELMLQGFSFEIMDGDVGHIPLKWVKDVFGQLANVLGNKKVFILSVLGIQSSGKSTLLNTMFGLQFEVAAGRCTRGVYAQLLPLSEEFSSEKYDYILVVDTEGLRANELAKAKLQHDNEIATLVIGIGDVTLVNIKGENVSDMEDVLEIVIHALLKMKLVNKNLELQPSCFFIHQNVPAVDASQNLRSGQQIFMETLDKVTKAAAKEEDAPEYTKFSQVIEFDINTCITYFSDLWKGNPPMATVNPGYSNNVNKVKQTLLTSIMHNRASQLTVQKLSQKLSDLWNGILDQNFIFSFRNTLEMDSYGTLTEKLVDLSWFLKDAALKWENHMKAKISKGEMDDHLNIDIMKECHKNLDEGYQTIKKRLEDFFKENEHYAVLEQWRLNTILKLETRYEEVVSKTASALRNEVGMRKIQIDQKRDIQKYKSNLMKEAKELAEGLESDIACDKLEKKFRQKWNSWIGNMPKIFNIENIDIQDIVYSIITERYKADKENIDIQDIVYSIITERYKADKAMVIYSWDEIQTKQKLTFEKFCDNVRYVLEREGVDSSKIKKILSLVGLVQTKEQFLQSSAHKLSNEFQNLIDCNKMGGFTEDFAEKVIHLTRQVINRLKGPSIKLKNEKKLKISIAIFACQYACNQCQDKDRVENENTMGSFGIHPIFENVLRNCMSSQLLPVFHELHDYYKAKQQNVSSFNFDVQKHFMNKCYKEENKHHAEKLTRELLENVKSYIEKREIQAFREEYIEIVMKMVEKLVKDNEGLFTKQFKMDLIAHACMFVIPVLREKHQRYIANTDAGAVFERDYYNTYYEMFRNFYHKFTGEKGLAMVLRQQLVKLVEHTIDNDMARVLAGDVRNNVEQVKLKSALLEAVLRKLLEEDNFDEFYLYLTDVNGCLEKWISSFINVFLFTETAKGNNRYIEIASLKVDTLISQLTQEISKSANVVSDNSDCREAMKEWTQNFHQRITEILPIPLHDLQSMIEEYDISSLKSFTDTLISKLLESKSMLVNVFENHDVNYLRTAHEDSVYKLILQECKGCTEQCPFCAAPCTLNTVGHYEQDVPVQHMAKEHYPQGCGRYFCVNNKKLVIENCSTSVASNCKFYSHIHRKYHPYKTYYKIHPSWKIHSDPSIETSPYWKWFLTKYGDRLAEKLKGEKPDIPESWHFITKEMAEESLNS